MSHLNGSKKCSQYFNLEIFKSEYTRHKANMRKRRQEAKQKAEDIDKFKENANARKRKLEAKQKAEDINKFKENVNQRKRNQEAKQRKEDALTIYNILILHTPIKNYGT